MVTELSAENGINFVGQVGFRGQTNDFLHRIGVSALEDEHARDARHRVIHGDVLGVIHVEFTHFDLAGKVVRQLIDDGR